MFNLFRSREKAVRIMLGGILGVVALSMVMYLVPGYGLNNGTTADDSVIAEVGGQKLTTQQAFTDFEKIAQQNQIDPERRSSVFPQYISSKVAYMAKAYEAERTGLTASDDEVLTGLMTVPSFKPFFPNGVLTSKDQFVQYLALQGSTLDDTITEMRDQILTTKLENVVYEGVVVTPKEVEDAYNRKNEKAKIQYIAFKTAKFADQVKPSEDELRKYFEARRSSYPTLEALGFQVVVLEQDKVESTITVTDAELHAAYAGALDNFRSPEKIHVRHILVKTTGKSDAEKKTLRTKADDLLKQLKSGANFADLAKKSSDDTASAEKGGDLDWIVKGQIQFPEFESAIFALKPQETSNVVTTEQGYEIAQVTERQASKLKPFEEVKDTLAADLRKETITDKMQMLGDQIHDALQKAPNSAAAVATKFGAELVTDPKWTLGQAIPTLGNSPEIDGALAAMKPNDVSPVLALPANRLAVVVLNSRIPAHPSDYSDVADKVRGDYIAAKAKDLVEAAAKDAADRLKKGEDIDAVAKSMKAEVTSTNYFGRSDAVDGLGAAAYVMAAFTKPAGSILGPSEIPPGSGTQVVSKVEAKQTADPAGLTAERAEIARKLKDDKAARLRDLLSDSIVAKLTNEGKLKVHPEALQRAISAYGQR
jgi:peptidyl-prolyl cis-trans isomerase D